jgi:CheY-like chemotaxis protein
MPASVLIVDDDADIRAAVADILRDEGFHVKEAVNGLDALEQIAEAEPDLVLLDLMMPVMTGWEVIDALRRHRRSLPIVVLSAVPFEGGTDYVQKPISLDRLLHLIDRVRTASMRRVPTAPPGQAAS